jgi:hypothetical protein
MQYITKSSNARLHQLLNQTGLTDDKKALVLSYSSKNSDSSKDLLDTEARALIRHLEGMVRNPDGPTEKALAADKMRRKILSLAHEMRWELPGGKVDMQRVNEWCQSYGFGKKTLNEHSYDELSKLVTQLKIVYQKFLEELAK